MTSSTSSPISSGLCSQSCSSKGANVSGSASNRVECWLVSEAKHKVELTLAFQERNESQRQLNAHAYGYLTPIHYLRCPKSTIHAISMPTSYKPPSRRFHPAIQTNEEQGREAKHSPPLTLTSIPTTSPTTYQTEEERKDNRPILLLCKANAPRVETLSHLSEHQVNPLQVKAGGEIGEKKKKRTRGKVGR